MNFIAFHSRNRRNRIGLFMQSEPAEGINAAGKIMCRVYDKAFMPTDEYDTSMIDWSASA